MNKIKTFENYSNTLFDREPDIRNQRSIFVSIVSYRDSNILNTVMSLFENAKRPSNIYVSVVISSIQNHENQWSNEDTIKELLGRYGTVKIKTVSAEENYSLGYLRSIADSSYNKEMYYMSVSSATEFDPHWDDILIKSYDSVFELSKNTNFVFTSIPRFFIRHDDVVDGYVFYTNHKTKISMQRTEKDSSKIPVVGYSDFIDVQDMSNSIFARSDLESAKYLEQLVKQQRSNLDFLKKNGYPTMGYRDFFDNEAIALSHGFSSKFVFGDAKTILKNNPGKKEMITESQNDFMSMLNFIDSGVTLYSLRWTPCYYLPDYSPSLSPERKNPEEMIKEDSIKNEGDNLIKNKVKNMLQSEDLEKRELFNMLCGIDWDTLDFKLSRQSLNSTVCSGVNTFISLYNFSRNENSLHWNKRG